MLKICADKSWINSKDRAFPVTIDPTIESQGIVWDSYTYKVSPNQNYGYDEKMWVSNYRTSYIYIENLPNLPSGATLNHASLCVPYYYDNNITEGGLLAGAYRVLEEWDESTITYNNAPAISTASLDTDILEATIYTLESTPGTACFIITDAVSDWYDDSSSNHGIAIKRESSSTYTNTAVQMKSYEANEEYACITVNYTYYVPDGVYALQNQFSTTRWMTIEDDSAWAGKHVQQVYSASSPASTSVFDRSSLFKISRVGSTSRYIIRSMLNNNLSFGISGTEIVTKEIPSADSAVSVGDTFYIEWDGNGFLIRQYGSANVIKMASTSTANLTTVAKTSANSYARWNLVQYTGVNKRGSVIYRPSNMNAGTTGTYTPVVWSTYIDYNTSELVLKSGYSNYATVTWNSSTRKATVSLHDDGVFKVTLYLYNGSHSSSYSSEYSYTITLVVDEGIYFFKNKGVGKYMQIDNNNSPDYNTSGTHMELWGFDGGDYQKWDLIHIRDGYYKILSVKSGMALCVPSESTNTDEVALIQQPYSNLSRMKWKISKSSSGSYILRPKSGESYAADWCICAGDEFLGITDGLNVEQKAYVNDNSYKDEWILEPYSVIFYGVTNSGHDHSSALSAIQSDLLASNWNSVVLRMGAISSGQCKSDLLSTNIFTSRSHGQTVLYSGSTNGAATGILLNDKTSSEAVHFYSHSWSGMNSGDNNIASNEDYSNVDIALFIGCETAYGGVGQRNLQTSIVNCGATASVGFTESIGCSAANTWTTNFYSKMRSGATLEEAVEYACNLASTSSGLKSAVICGDGTIVFPQ